MTLCGLVQFRQNLHFRLESFRRQFSISFWKLFWVLAKSVIFKEFPFQKFSEFDGIQLFSYWNDALQKLYGIAQTKPRNFAKSKLKLYPAVGTENLIKINWKNLQKSLLRGDYFCTSRLPTSHRVLWTYWTLEELKTVTFDQKNLEILWYKFRLAPL